MAETIAKLIPLSGSPQVWVNKVESSSVSNLWKFDNASSVEVVIKLPSTAASTGEKTEITRIDNVIYQFAKFSKRIGLDAYGLEENQTTAAEDSDATNLGTIKFTINEGDMDAATWTAFLQEVQDNLDQLCIVTVGTGFTYNNLTEPTYAKPDGFINMMGKLTADITLSMTNNPTQITFEFASYKLPITSSVDVADIEGLYDGASLLNIPWKLGAAADDIACYPPIIEDTTTPTVKTDATDLMAGYPVIIKNVASYT